MSIINSSFSAIDRLANVAKNSCASPTNPLERILAHRYIFVDSRVFPFHFGPNVLIEDSYGEGSYRITPYIEGQSQARLTNRNLRLGQIKFVIENLVPRVSTVKYNDSNGQMYATLVVQEKYAMICTVEGCPGQYEERYIVHTVRHLGQVIVFDRVPAEVCAVCGDVLFRPETVRRIEERLRHLERPSRTVPLYDYA